MRELANGLDRLTASEQREFQSRMERKQMKEFMGVSLHLFVVLGTSAGQWEASSMASSNAMQCNGFEAFCQELHGLVHQSFNDVSCSASTTSIAIWMAEC